MPQRPPWGVFCSLVVALTSCSSDPPPAGLGQSCESRPCDDGLTCSDGVCASPCNVDTDCLLRNDRCFSGVCVDVVSCADASDCRFPGACETVDGASCVSSACVYGADPACGGSCATEGDCSSQEYCGASGICTLKLIDGTSCAGLTSTACASGFCDPDTSLCCSGTDCCTGVGDCPGSYTLAPSCSDTSPATNCQGTRGDPVCTNFVCSTILVDDDSACDGSIRTCPNNFASITCTNAQDQLDPVCGTTCSNATECATGFACQAPNCVVPFGVGDACTGMGQGTCVTGLECENAVCCAAGATTCCEDAGDCGGNLACDGVTSTCFESCGNFDDSRCADPSSQYCLSNQCVAKLAQGADCGNDGECLSGSCVEGVCCENDCAAECSSCVMDSTGQADGLCRDAFVGNACNDGNANTAIDVCDGSGTCVGIDDSDIEPLARYWINEANSGQLITQLVDSTTDPVNLPLAYADANTPVFAEGADGNRHLFFSPTTPMADTGAARVDIAGTKLAAMHGATEATLVAKYSVGDCSGEMRVLGFGDGNANSSGWLTLRTSATEHNVYIKWQGQSSASVYTFTDGTCALHQPVVVHVVVDTSRPANERVLLAVNGFVVEPTLFSGPAAPSGGLIDLGGGVRRLYLGGPHSDTRTALSRIYYAAVYDRALPYDQLWQEQARILANDDAPSGRGVVTTPVCTDDCNATSPSIWESARDGNLTTRVVLQVVPLSGTFQNGETVSSPDCSGTFVIGDVPEIMSVDNGVGACVEGSIITGMTSGAEALILDDLISGGTIEMAWVVAGSYDSVIIDGSVTDADHYMWLNAGPADLHRGVPGAGVVIDPSSDVHGIDVRDDYTRVEWMEVTDWSGAGDSFDGINITGDQVAINAALVHDDGHTIANSDANGITVESDGISVAVANSIVYNVARSGITIHRVAATLSVSNSSVFNCVLEDNNPFFYGCVGMRDGSGSTMTINNVIAMGAAAGSDFFNGGVMMGVFGPLSSDNMSSDMSAVGTDVVTGASAAATFVSVMAGSEDLHILPAGPADGVGSQGSYHDIDGDWRLGPSYNMGADAFAP